MAERRVAVLSLSPQAALDGLLGRVRAVNLPQDAEALRVTYDITTDNVLILVGSQQFSALEEGARAPIITAKLQFVEGGLIGQ